MKKVLIATDFSPHAARATEHGLALATLYGASVELFSSAYIPPQALAAVAGGMAPGLIEDARDGARKELAALAALLEKRGTKVTTSLSTEEPSTAICQRASELGADLIVTGTRGHTGLAHVLFGSIAERVARLAKAAVLTAHSDTPAPGQYRRVLVPTDFSSDANAAIAFARGLVQKTGGKLILLHSYDLPALLTGGAPIAVADLEKSLEISSRERMAALRASLGGLDVETVVVNGRPDGAILELAQSASVDLIAMGTRGRTGLAHVVIGSVTERVLRRAHAPVVALKAAAQA